MLDICIGGAKIHFAGWTPLTVVGFRIRKPKAPAIELAHGWGDIGGTLVLVDGEIEETKADEPAIDNEVGKTLYLRNIYFSGTEAIKSMGQPAVKCSGEWTHVKEYTYCDRVSKQEHKSYNLIDGKLNQEEIVLVDMDSSPPPAFPEIQIPSSVLYLRNLILLLTPCEGGGKTWLPGEMNLYLIVYEFVHQQVISPLICFIVVESDNWLLLWCLL
jgi:hypothetical protein